MPPHLRYGYVTLLVAAFPLAPLMACASSFAALRVDGWLLGQRSRRPWPGGAEDVGTWQAVFELISSLAVVTNVALVVFTGRLLQDYRVVERGVVFLALEVNRVEPAQP